MKFLRKTLDKVKPTFSEGGKLSFLQSTFEAIETFLFVPNHTTHGGTHIRDGIDLKRTMITVVLALVPCLVWGIFNVGYQHFLSLGQTGSFFSVQNFLFGLEKVFPIIIVSYVSGLTVEFMFAQIRRHSVNEGFLVTGILIPLIMPPDVPLWMVSMSTIFAVVVGKEIFGGTGMNFLNPALTARVFLFFAYPTKISGDLVWVAEKADGYSGATNLSLASTGGQSAMINTDWQMFMGYEMGSIGETSVLMCLIGAAILIVTGIGSWRIMITAVIGALVMGYILNLVGAGPFAEVEPYKHLLMGGFMFGAVFMATDPVSAAQTQTGKLWYGFFIGIFCVFVRVINPAYPEGMMLAILLMNVFAPLIDYFVIESNKKKRLKRAKI
jgi:Na+-transporting NADH:ubiquinone oxidoreductase subunit B